MLALLFGATSVQAQTVIDVPAGETHTIAGTYPSGHANGGNVAATGTLRLHNGWLVNDGTLSNYGDIFEEALEFQFTNQGTLNNWGSFDGPVIINGLAGTIYNYGDLDNSYLLQNDGHIVNHGSSDLTGIINKGEIDNYGDMIINYYMTNYYVINNERNLTFNDHGVDSLYNYLSFFNKGNFTLKGAFINGKYLTNATGYIENLGRIQNNDTVTNTGTIDSHGTIQNDGTFDNQGTLNLYGSLVNTAAFDNGTNGQVFVGLGGNSGSFSGDIDNGGSLIFDRSDAAVYDGSISGAGTVRKQGSGVLAMSGDSDAFTGHVSVDSGTLLVNGSIANSTMTVGSGATLSGNGTAGDVTVLDGGILAPGSSPGQLTVAGDLVLSSGSVLNFELGPAGVVGGGVNDLTEVTGNLTLDGVLNVTDQGGFGAGVYRIFDYGGTLTDDGIAIGILPGGTVDDDIFIQTVVDKQVNLVSTAGSVLGFWDGGDIALRDNGAIDGGAGTWRADGRNWTGADGALNGPFQPNPTFAVFQNTGGVVTVDASAGAIGATGLQFAADGYVIEGDAIALQGAGGETIIRVGDGFATGAGMTATIASELSGNSTLVKNDHGALILTGNNSYTGGTTIVGGTLQLGNGGATGSIAGDVLNDGVLAFDSSDTLTFSGAISGSGAVQQIGPGTTILTEDNAYTGDTTIADGTLQLGNGGTAGSIVGDVVNDGVLVFDRANALTYAGAISGTGAIRQIGVTRTEFTGNSSGFAGTTTVEDGVLAVNGHLGGLVSVMSAGRLQGNGMVGDTVVAGTVAPGNSIGTLNVAGNILFNPNATYDVEANAAGQADRIDATGMATIEGGAVQVLAGTGNYVPTTHYTILTANGGRDGTFDTVTSNFAFLDPSLSYDPNNVYLTLTRNNIDFGRLGSTPNQIATGVGTESLGFGNPAYNAVLNLSTGQARYAFDELSGELHASARTALIEDSRFVRNLVDDRIRAASGAATTDSLGVWGQGFGSWGYTGSDGNAAHLDRSTGGFFIGADGPAFNTWRLGAVAGHSSTTFKVDDRSSSGTSNDYHVGLYGGTQWSNLAFNIGAAHTWHDISTGRIVAFPGFGDSLHGHYNAAATQVFGELGYDIQVSDFVVEPFGSFAYVNLHTSGFTEKGGPAALTSTPVNTGTTFTTLGLRASTSFSMGGTVVTAGGMLGWRHAFGDAAPLSQMQFASGDMFAIGGVPITRDAAAVEADFDFTLSPAATLGMSYGGQFGPNLSDQSFKANFNVKF
ncbi:autotransporter domain-containing protein [Devosia ginsengisoli]|uniref:autotransporter domain-containing protein n=1 Tax=Devosia ginsengisoli TaxID=400770 RepID=UPI0016488D9A|nr:autotransporter domain-containing protein [Devosia ginsengisoli]